MARKSKSTKSMIARSPAGIIGAQHTIETHGGFPLHEWTAVQSIDIQLSENIAEHWKRQSEAELARYISITKQLEDGELTRRTLLLRYFWADQLFRISVVVIAAYIITTGGASVVSTSLSAAAIILLKELVVRYSGKQIQSRKE